MDFIKEFFGNIKIWKTVILITVIFLFIVNPFTYKLLDGITGEYINLANMEGCPTTHGMLIHAFIFLVILRLVFAFGLI
uniref:Uncharacterized protein n=1 Tax=Mimivirus LCMiAC02 TaxID=2506609 RepID=A0A4P6VS31_9VIRU|nr:MAG: uncharacterized protein LCMiAC02_04660 [Mimivirus LCMiAC02]